ncbi:MAG TPA: protein translocase subunit SecF [Pseudonocardiaceae bacterium]
MNSTGDTLPVTPGGVFTRLYTGTGAFDIVGRRKMWYVITALLVVICIGSMVFKGFNLGIDFVGGTRLQFPVAAADGQRITTEQAEEVFTATLGKEVVSTQIVGQGDAATVLLRSETLTAEEVVDLKAAISEDLKPLASDGQPTTAAISDSAVSASWGGEISQKALVALLVFLIMVSLFIAFYFERAMAVGALIALLHDVVLTAGVYSLVGFEVSPATIIGLLTILGFSLYDTVVVFDKVQENTRGILGLTRRTYGEAANLAINQTLMRSINTSLIAVLPVIGLLVIGVGLLGVGTLKDLALVQMVGIIAGAFSSIVLAVPVVVDLTMRRPAYQQQFQRVMQRRANVARKAAEGGVAAADAPQDTPPGTDDESIAAEQRRENALAAAASVPTRVGKTGPQPQRRTRPSGKAGRPSGKKRRV